MCLHPHPVSLYCFFLLHRKKRKTWLGTISGTMSHWSGVIFRSGLVTLKESGWWKLISDNAPTDIISNAPSKYIKVAGLEVSGLKGGLAKSGIQTKGRLRPKGTTYAIACLTCICWRAVGCR